MKKIELKKISLSTIENALSRSEMKTIMAGSGNIGYQCCTAGGGTCGECRKWVNGQGMPSCSSPYVVTEC